MSHTAGRVVTFPAIRIGPDTGSPPNAGANWELSFVPQPALPPAGGDPRFVIIHLTALSLPGTSRAEIELGYDTDVITAAFGSEAWSRPINPKLGPIVIRFVGSAGGATLADYGSGEPTATTHPSSPWQNGVTNTDLFLHTNPYQEPTYQQWLQCGGTINWQNAACAASDPVKKATAAAVGMIISYSKHDSEQAVSTCTVTLIDTDLIVTARHCVADPNDLEVRSGSVTFDFATDCTPVDGAKPQPYSPRFHKVRGRVLTGLLNDTDGDWAILKIDPPPSGITPRSSAPQCRRQANRSSPFTIRTVPSRRFSPAACRVEASETSSISTTQAEAQARPSSTPTGTSSEQRCRGATLATFPVASNTRRPLRCVLP